MKKTEIFRNVTTVTLPVVLVVFGLSWLIWRNVVGAAVLPIILLISSLYCNITAYLAEAERETTGVTKEKSNATGVKPRKHKRHEHSTCHMREELLKKIQLQYDMNPEIPPVVGLDEYFLGNGEEECIAPNQVGYGRPKLAELYARFREIQQRPDVQTVLVGIHGDWEEAKEDPTMWPAAENVHIYTTASQDEVERWLSGLEADGAIEGWPYGMHPAAPPVKSGFKVFSVCWD